MINLPIIIVDTREQEPLKPFLISDGERLYLPTESAKLDVGDYALKGHETTIAIERKSGPDLYGTLTAGRARFLEEWRRAQGYARKYVLIECSYDEFSLWIENTGRRMPAWRLDATMLALTNDCNLHFIWCSKHGRTEAEYFIGFVLNRLHEQLNDPKAIRKARERGFSMPWLPSGES